MTDAIKCIVDGYVSLKNRQALEELRAHRQRLRKQLEDLPLSWIDASRTIKLFEDDLRVIESGLAQL
jgi:hypothetical protein